MCQQEIAMVTIHPTTDYINLKNHQMVEEPRRTESNRKDGDESFCPQKIDVDER